VHAVAEVFHIPLFSSIQEVVPNSPAALGGLKAAEDYILGTAEHVFFDSDDFYDEVEDSLDQPLQVYVYNIESDEVRQCQITPTRNWGGPGILGDWINTCLDSLMYYTQVPVLPMDGCTFCPKNASKRLALPLVSCHYPLLVCF
jgi:hypothetical protein